MSNDDADREYEFYPEDFEGDGNPTDRSLDLAPVVIGLCIGLGGVLFLLEPVVDPISVAGAELRPMTLSATALAAGLLGGATLYGRRGRDLLAIAHAIGGIGWVLVVAGHLLGVELLLFAGIAVLLAGSLSLIALVVRR